MNKAKVDFLWYKAGDEIKDEDKPHVTQWTKEGFIESKEIKQDSLDLNGDGVVDSKDMSIAGKVLSKGRSKKKGKK